MNEIILEKRYPHSRSEDITDAFMRGYVKGKADRPQGEWKPFDLKWGREIYACTSCGESVEVPICMNKPLFKFCPLCGAKMVKDDE